MAAVLTGVEIVNGQGNKDKLQMVKHKTREPSPLKTVTLRPCSNNRPLHTKVQFRCYMCITPFVALIDKRKLWSLYFMVDRSR